MTGQDYTVSVSVAPVAPGAGVPAGTVTVTDSDANTCVVTLLAGVGSCVLPSSSAGAKTLDAHYDGDADFIASDATQAGHQVDQAGTTTTITGDGPDPSVTGQDYTVSVSVAPVAPGAGVPAGTVTVTDSDANTCVVTLLAGVGSCVLPSSSAGPKTLDAHYDGDADYNQSDADQASHAVDTAGTVDDDHE